MDIRDRLRVRVERYEQATIVGVVLLLLGSASGWLTVEADAEAAARSDSLEAGVTTFTGMDLGWGVLTFGFALLAAVVVGLVLWRYDGAGRKTGLVVMLAGLLSFAVAVIGIVLTGVLFAPAGEIEGVSVDLGVGIMLALVGSLALLAGGVLRIAAGPTAGAGTTAPNEDGEEDLDAGTASGSA